MRRGFMNSAFVWSPAFRRPCAEGAGARNADVLSVAQIFNRLVSGEIPSSGEDFASAEKQPASRHAAKRLECAQLAAAIERHWISGRSGALDRLATFDSGSKLRALQ